MQKLSNSVYLYEPKSKPDPVTTSDDAAPRLILVGGWMDARDVHLAKYVRKYQELFPTSAILLLKSTLAGVNIYSVGRGHARAAVEPLRRILREELDSSPSSQPSLSSSLPSPPSLSLSPSLSPSPSSSASSSTSSSPSRSPAPSRSSSLSSTSSLFSSAYADRRRPRLLVHILSGGGTCSLHHLYDFYAQHIHQDGSPLSASSALSRRVRLLVYFFVCLTSVKALLSIGRSRRFVSGYKVNLPKSMSVLHLPNSSFSSSQSQASALSSSYPSSDTLPDYLRGAQHCAVSYYVLGYYLHYTAASFGTKRPRRAWRKSSLGIRKTRRREGRRRQPQ